MRTRAPQLIGGVAGALGAHTAAVSLAPDSWYAGLFFRRDGDQEVPADHPLARRVRAVADHMGMEGGGLRVFVASGSCAGSVGVPFRAVGAPARITLPMSFAELCEDLAAGAAAGRGQLHRNDSAEAGAGWLLQGVPLSPSLVLPSEGEVDFTIAHELTHVKHADSLVGGLVASTSLLLSFRGADLVASRVAPRRLLPAHIKAGFVGTLAVVGSASSVMLVTRFQEWRADRGAARAGFALGGLHTFERAKALNRAVKGVVGNALITRDGDFLGDAMHPPLTDRVAHMRDRLLHGRESDAVRGAWASVASSAAILARHVCDTAAELAAAALLFDGYYRRNAEGGAAAGAADEHEDAGDAHVVPALPVPLRGSVHAEPNDYGLALALSVARRPTAER